MTGLTRQFVMAGFDPPSLVRHCGLDPPVRHDGLDPPVRHGGL
ncbi:MAG: hypothetical protein V1781_00355 [Bacteroidota bacterium]